MSGEAAFWVLVGVSVVLLAAAFAVAFLPGLAAKGDAALDWSTSPDDAYMGEADDGFVTQLGEWYLRGSDE